MKHRKQITRIGVAGISRRGILGLLTIGLSLALSLVASTALAQKGKPPKDDGGGGGGGNPANSAIAYIGRGALKVMDADGANQTQVLAANSKHQYVYPTWYPDGQHILFYSTLDGAGFYRIKLDGSGLTKVVSMYSTTWKSQAEVSPAPSADGQYRIAFEDRVPGDSGIKIMVVKENGSGLTQVTFGSSSFDPSWSPDGQRLACVHYGDRSVPGVDGLRLLTLGELEDGSALVLDDSLLLPFDPEGPFADGAAWASFSPAQNKIYFTGFPDWTSSGDLWALHLDEFSEPVLLEQLTVTPDLMERDVSGSADDSKIAYEISSTIYVANSDGSNPVALPRPVVKGKSEAHRHPAFRR